MSVAIDDLREATDAIVSVDELDAETMWRHSPTRIWRARWFRGYPNFYPVYQYQDLYSYCPMSLVSHKGSLRVNARVVAEAEAEGFMYLSGRETIDRDIFRLGGPHESGTLIQDVEEYARRVADALRRDTSEVEHAHPGHHNLIMCGGKDSLNLLLLPWKNSTSVLSADPNFPLVERFVKDNDLPFEVTRLDDRHDAAHLEREVLLACCRADLTHWRWGGHLMKLSKDHAQRAIFWKGQVADLYTSNKWKGFMHPASRMRQAPLKVYKRLERPLPFRVNRMIGRALQPSVIRATWDRCAFLQGCHMGFLRALTGSLFLSAYHGPEMMSVWAKADLASVAQKDMRHLVGRQLLGREVRYPTENPAPPPSSARQGLHAPRRFLALVSELGISIEAG